MSEITAKKKEKKGFKMPHLLWIMLGLVLIMSLLTYVVPAGTFAKDDKGNLIGTQFSYLGQQTPVSPLRAAMMLLDGLTGSGVIIWAVLAGGASIGIALSTGAIDDLLNWAIYKLKDKGDKVLLPILFMLMVYLGGFGGSDALIAVVPIGVIFAKKMKLDPIVAIGVTTFATLIGFGTGPTKLMIPQSMMDVPVYSGFGARFLSMNFFGIVGLLYLMWYVKKIKKNPAASILGNAEWLDELGNVEDSAIKDVRLTWRTVLILIVFIGQYILIVWYGMVNSASLYPFMIATHIVAGVLCGVIAGMDADKIGNEFAKGISGMAFVGFVIGMARVVSLIMNEGQIIHTMVYALTRPLMNLDRGLSAIGITAIIGVINPLIPSASSKAAILMPIVKPVTEALGMHPQIAVSAFQYGDGFTNLVSPALGWMIGSAAVAKVPFDRWIKWAMPIVIIMIALSFGWVYILNAMEWTGL